MDAMDSPPPCPRRLNLDGFFHNVWVLGGLAFFWLLGSVTLLVGVIATMKLAYLPTDHKKTAPQVMGLTKSEALVLVAFSVTVHLILLFLFLAMVLKERSYRCDFREEEGREGATNTEGNRWMEEDVGTTKEKEGDLPPCYDCLLGEETPPPPFHSLILRAAYSSNSLSSQGQDTWPCLSSEYQTPDADKPNLEHVPVVKDTTAVVDNPNFKHIGENATGDVVMPYLEQNGGDEDEIGHVDQPQTVNRGVSNLKTKDSVGPNGKHSIAIGIEISTGFSTNLELKRFVQVIDAQKPNLDQVGVDEQMDKCNPEQGGTADSVTTIAGWPELKQTDEVVLTQVADSDKTILEQMDHSKFFPDTQIGNLNQNTVVDHNMAVRGKTYAEHKYKTTHETSNITSPRLEHSEYFQNMACNSEASVVFDEDNIKFWSGGDAGPIKPRMCEQYAPTENKNDRPFKPELSDVNRLSEFDCYEERLTHALEFSTHFTVPLFGSERCALRHLRYNLDDSTVSSVPKFNVEIGKGSDISVDAENNDNVDESTGSQFNTSTDEDSSHSESLNEDDTDGNRTITDEGGTTTIVETELFPVMYADPRLKLPEKWFVHEENVTIYDDEAIYRFNRETNLENDFQKAESSDILPHMLNEDEETKNSYKTDKHFRNFYSSSQDKFLLEMGKEQKGNHSHLHGPIFALREDQGSEVAFSTIRGSLSRQTKSSLGGHERMSYSVHNSYGKRRNSNFSNTSEPLHHTSFLMPSRSTSESVGLTDFPAVARIEFNPRFYFSQTNFNSLAIPCFTDVKESLESGIQSCTSLVDSLDLEPFDHSSDLLRQDLNLDSAVGSYVSITRQNCTSEADDHDAQIAMV